MIKRLSEARRMPRLGKIHLGVKRDKKKDGTPCSPYPSEVEYFVCPSEVQKVFGEKPTSLRIMIPVEDREAFFPQFYKRYTVNLLQCKGTGEKAYCWGDDGGLKEIPCPCNFLKTGECKPIGILCFLMPDIPGFGVYQITTSSKNSIIDLNSGLDMVTQIAKRVRMIPLVLRREKMDIQRIEGGQPKKSTHYTMKIDLDANVSLRQLQEYGQRVPETILLPPPDESKDELFFPKNGFVPAGETEDAAPAEIVEPNKPETENSEEERVAFEKAEFTKYGHNLEALLQEYQALGGKIGKNQAARIVELKTAEEVKKAIKFYGGEKAKIEKKGKKSTERDSEIPF